MPKRALVDVIVRHHWRGLTEAGQAPTTAAEEVHALHEELHGLLQGELQAKASEEGATTAEVAAAAKAPNPRHALVDLVMKRRWPASQAVEEKVKADLFRGGTLKTKVGQLALSPPPPPSEEPPAGEFGTYEELLHMYIESEAARRALETKTEAIMPPRP